MNSGHEEIQLAWLRAFLAVYSTGSFTAAARHIHRVQSRVSAQIAQLEQQVGAQLFVRGRQPARLTDAGHEFLPYAQAALREIEAGTAAVSAQRGTIRGRVSVSAFPGVSALVLAPFITAFCARYPDAHIDLFDGAGHHPTRAIVHGDVDLAIRTAPERVDAHTILIRPLFREPIVCVAPTDHPAAQREHVTPEIFTGEQVIVPGNASAKHSKYSALLSSSGCLPARELIVDQPTTVMGFIAAGNGIGVLPALAAHLVRPPDVRILPIDASEFIRDVVLITNRTRKYPPVVQRFVHDLLAYPLHPVLMNPNH